MYIQYNNVNFKRSNETPVHGHAGTVLWHDQWREIKWSMLVLKGYRLRHGPLVGCQCAMNYNDEDSVHYTAVYTGQDEAVWTFMYIGTHRA